ncbi:hypothetical protein [Dysgonomonas sp. ZJ709]|uniref:hypothetical protein n=1 Tax=Dysgonomonas sp. ZJ709 TaxID=2709797 RepID=UPI0013E9F8A7|nr:hypothetical protein [Dysgonomonas sp. ZJ709]
MKDIDKIIEKYFDGDTSLAEEKMLRNYFLQADIEERHRVYAPMFNFFAEERKETTETKPKKAKKRFSLYAWSSIAACILLLAVMRLAYMTPENVNDQSMVYIDGKRISDVHIINNQALISIENISDVDEDVLNSQIGILNSFTE